MFHATVMLDQMMPMVQGMSAFMFFWFIVLPTLLVVLLLVLVFRLLRGRSAGMASLAPNDDVRLLQEMHALLARLETRVDALETLVADKDHRGNTGGRS